MFYFFPNWSYQEAENFRRFFSGWVSGFSPWWGFLHPFWVPDFLGMIRCFRMFGCLQLRSSEASPLTVVVEFYDVWFFQQQHPLQKIQVYGEIVVVVAVVVVVVVVVVGLYDVISTTFLLLTLFYLLPVISFKVHKAVKALVTHWFCLFPFIGAP